VRRRARYAIPSHPLRRARLALPAGLAGLLVATATFRSAQNMAQTTLALLGRQDFGLSDAAIGAIGALWGLLGVAVTVLVARRVPTGRARRGAAVGIGLLVIALVMFALAHSLVLLVTAVVVMGAAGGLAMPSLATAAGSAGGDQGQRALGLYALVLSASLALGPLLEAAVLDVARQALRVPFAVFAVLPVAGLVVLGAGRREERPRTAGLVQAGDEEGAGQGGVPAGDTGVSDRARVGARPAPAGAASATSPPEGATFPLDGLASPGPRGGPPEPARSTPLLRVPGWRLALVGQLLYTIPFAGIVVFGPLVGHVRFGVKPSVVQLAFTVFFITSFASRALVLWRTPIRRKLPLFWLAAGLTAAGLALLGLGHGLGVLLLAMAVLGVPHGLTFPLVLALVAESCPGEALARANATLMAATNLTTIAVPFLLGALVPALGYGGMVLTMLVPVALFSTLLARERSPTTAGT